MDKRIVLRAERHGDITRFIDQDGWTRGLLWWESGLDMYLAFAPIGLQGKELCYEKRYENKARAIAETKRIIKEAWNGPR